MEIFIKVTIQMENQMDSENITGKTEAISKVILEMASGMVKAYGREELEIRINMKESIKTIKNVDMESLHGQLGMCIREIMREISEMDMDKCIGTIVVFTKGTGKMEFRTEMDRYM